MTSIDQIDAQTLCILQEECSEVIQAICKCLRFGYNSCHPETGVMNIERLEEELGDLLAMVDKLYIHGIVSQYDVELHKANKFEKLKRWSDI